MLSVTGSTPWYMFVLRYLGVKVLIALEHWVPIAWAAVIAFIASCAKGIYKWCAETDWERMVNRVFPRKRK